MCDNKTTLFKPLNVILSIVVDLLLSFPLLGKDLEG